MRLLPCGERNLLIECDDMHQALCVFGELQRAQEQQQNSIFCAIQQLIPAARTVCVEFDPLYVTCAAMGEAIEELDISDTVHSSAREVTIPVVYDGEDLADVAHLLGVSGDHVIAKHGASPWNVAFVGFAPGFAYMTGGDALFDVPRKATPRLRVPAGSVGLAGTFSGVYPRESSGGWQLLGHTDVPMWDKRQANPAYLQPGDTVQFVAVRPQVHAVAPPPLAASEEREINNVSRETLFNLTHSSEPLDPSNATVAGESYAEPALAIVRPGMMATIQDDGRKAANMGVTGSGAADPLSFHRANALVGNPLNTPAIELTAGNAILRAQGNLVLAVTGAPVPITVGNSHTRTAIMRQEAILVRSGETIEIGTPQCGLRNYIAVRGGFVLNAVLGSASTDTMSGIGPAILTPQTCLPIQSPSTSSRTSVTPLTSNSVGIPVPWDTSLPRKHAITQLDILAGPRMDWFTPDAIDLLTAQHWLVTKQSNRVGLRLTGERPLTRTHTQELASEATVQGAIEVPTSGQPVLFLRDQPVTGGYPVIAVLTQTALTLAGQLPPESLVQFRLLT